jgi:hypothetical protein
MKDHLREILQSLPRLSRAVPGMFEDDALAPTEPAKARRSVR